MEWDNESVIKAIVDFWFDCCRISDAVSLCRLSPWFGLLLRFSFFPQYIRQARCCFQLVPFVIIKYGDDKPYFHRLLAFVIAVSRSTIYAVSIERSGGYRYQLSPMSKDRIIPVIVALCCRKAAMTLSRRCYFHDYYAVASGIILPASFIFFLKQSTWIKITLVP